MYGLCHQSRIFCTALRKFQTLSVENTRCMIIRFNVNGTYRKTKPLKNFTKKSTKYDLLDFENY